MWEGNMGTVINDLNHCKVCVAEHTNPPRPTRAIHMVEDNLEASEAIANPQTKKILKKRMYTNPTEVNVSDWVYLR